MVEINWTELALQDLRDIYDYISKDSVFMQIVILINWLKESIN